jgi:hypothetical protein
MSVRPTRFVFGPGPRNDWQAGSIDLAVTTGRRRCADMRSPEIATAICSVSIGSKISGRVIRAVVPCTVRQSRNRLADRSHLDAILLELLPSKLENFTERVRLSVQAEQGVIGLTRGIKPRISHAVLVKK